MSHVGTQQFSGAETNGRQPSASQENLPQCRASSTSSLVGQNTSTSAHDIHLNLLNPSRIIKCLCSGTSLWMKQTIQIR